MDELTELLRKPHYKVEKIENGLNKHVRRHFHCLMRASYLLAGLWIVCVLLVPALDGRWALERQLLYSTTKFMTWLTGMAGIFWIILFLEWVTNGNILGRILSDARASAYLVAVIVFAASFIYAWG